MEMIKDLYEAKGQKLPAPRFPQTSSIASEDGGGKISAKDMLLLLISTYNCELNYGSWR